MNVDRSFSSCSLLLMKRVSVAQYYNEVQKLAIQLGLDMGLVMQEIQWALGEERINKVTPSDDKFKDWSCQSSGLMSFWTYANTVLATELEPDEIHDLWQCINLTLKSKKRKPFNFQDYMMIAIRSEQKCSMCHRKPPEVKLEIDHILPVSRGGTNTSLNLRFLCQYHNRSRGNRFRWADIWREI